MVCCGDVYILFSFQNVEIPDDIKYISSIRLLLVKPIPLRGMSFVSCVFVLCMIVCEWTTTETDHTAFFYFGYTAGIPC